MKPIRFFPRLSVMLLCAAAAVPVFAQAPSAKPLPPPAGSGLGGVAANPTASVTPSSMVAPGFSCEVPASPLAEALATVSKAAEARGVEMPNTLFAADAAELKVPRLKLRSVTPAGALSLLAAAAGCDVEQVVTPDTGEVSGWMFKAKPPQHNNGQPWAGFGGRGDPSLYKPLAGGGADQEQLALSDGNAFGGGSRIQELTSGVAANKPAVSMELHSGAPTAAPRPPEPIGVIGIGGGKFSQISQTPVTRVYAVGLLLDEAKPEAAKLLQETLLRVLDLAEDGEKSRTPPSLSFHDGTKLIVAKATPEEQVLIEQTLKAMTQNANDLKSRRAVNALRQRAVEGLGRAEPAPGDDEKSATPGSPQPASQPPKR